MRILLSFALCVGIGAVGRCADSARVLRDAVLRPQSHETYRDLPNLLSFQNGVPFEMLVALQELEAVPLDATRAALGELTSRLPEGYVDQLGSLVRSEVNEEERAKSFAETFAAAYRKARSESYESVRLGVAEVLNEFADGRMDRDRLEREAQRFGAYRLFGDPFKMLTNGLATVARSAREEATLEEAKRIAARLAAAPTEAAVRAGEGRRPWLTLAPSSKKSAAPPWSPGFVIRAFFDAFPDGNIIDAKLRPPWVSLADRASRIPFVTANWGDPNSPDREVFVVFNQPPDEKLRKVLFSLGAVVETGEPTAFILYPGKQTTHILIAQTVFDRLDKSEFALIFDTWGVGIVRKIDGEFLLETMYRRNAGDARIPIRYEGSSDLPSLLAARGIVADRGTFPSDFYVHPALLTPEQAQAKLQKAQ